MDPNPSETLIKLEKNFRKNFRKPFTKLQKNFIRDAASEVEGHAEPRIHTPINRTQGRGASSPNKNHNRTPRFVAIDRLGPESTNADAASGLSIM